MLSQNKYTYVRFVCDVDVELQRKEFARREFYSVRKSLGWPEDLSGVVTCLLRSSGSIQFASINETPQRRISKCR